MLIAVLASLFFSASCEKNTPSMQDSMPIDYGYGVSIDLPLENAMYTVGDTLPLSILFTSATKEIIHYISVDVLSEADNSVKLYSVVAHQHVPEVFTYKDDFLLKDTLKIVSDTNWIIKAAMWSHEMDQDTIYEVVNIEINSQP